MRSFHVGFVCTILLHPFVLGGQAITANPERVVKDFFQAEEDGRWLDAAHKLDLKRFETIRRSTVTAWRSLPPPDFPKTAQDLMKWDPEMPLAVAEYQLKKMKNSMRDTDFLSYEYARVPSVDSLAALPVDVAAARWLEAKGRKWQGELIRRQLSQRQGANCPPSPDSAIAKIEADATQPVATILGATEKSDSVRYVIVGSSMPVNSGAKKTAPAELPEGTPPSVITLRRAKDGWKIVPSYDMPSSEGVAISTIFGTFCETDFPRAPREDR